MPNPDFILSNRENVFILGGILNVFLVYLSVEKTGLYFVSTPELANKMEPPVLVCLLNVTIDDL